MGEKKKRKKRQETTLTYTAASAGHLYVASFASPRALHVALVQVGASVRTAHGFVTHMRTADRTLNLAFSPLTVLHHELHLNKTQVFVNEERISLSLIFLVA